MADRKWTFDEADGHLWEVLDRVQSDGPQEVTREGESFVVVPARQWHERAGQGTGGSNQQDGFAVSLESIRSELNRTELRDPFAWVDEMSEEEARDWQERLEAARRERALRRNAPG
jgi:prevent-host-death family protein